MLALYLFSIPEMGAFIPDSKGDFIQPSVRDLDLKKLANRMFGMPLGIILLIKLFQLFLESVV
jgi:hypothetical protein